MKKQNRCYIKKIYGDYNYEAFVDDKLIYTGSRKECLHAIAVFNSKENGDHPTITFFNYYDKFNTFGKQIPLHAVLLEVLVTDLQDLSDTFKNYDTSFPGGNFRLPKKGKYLLLIFNYERGAFTTLRKWNKRKESTYRKLIGKTFGIRVGEEL
ncbi:hypothetical protein [Leptospira ilyithenensis]|uniref:Uncharacterized protein n=1 Tax=Leptospira ilyithenensis TaxID=2484901 RepID=A0A4R9LMR3_9LEPT|nr:hypothetical protein [Leptospira ilyithenensis]TGN09778.1 hypothetical protein EHS11_11895 [Leptospira ilyithenensis]